MQSTVSIRSVLICDYLRIIKVTSNNDFGKISNEVFARLRHFRYLKTVRFYYKRSGELPGKSRDTLNFIHGKFLIAFCRLYASVKYLKINK